jgi:hypothetical protein
MVAVAVIIPVFLNFADFGFKSTFVNWLFPIVLSIMIIFYYDIIFFLGVNIQLYLKYNSSTSTYRGTYFDFIFGEWFRYRFANHDQRSLVVFRSLFTITIFVNMVCLVFKAINFRISMNKFDKLR